MTGWLKPRSCFSVGISPLCLWEWSGDGAQLPSEPQPWAVWVPRGVQSRLLRGSELRFLCLSFFFFFFSVAHNTQSCLTTGKAGIPLPIPLDYISSLMSLNANHQSSVLSAPLHIWFVTWYIRDTWLEGRLLRPEASSTTHKLCTMFGMPKTP